MSDTNNLVDAYGKAVLELEQNKNLIEEAEARVKEAERDVQVARKTKHQILENLINARKKLTEELDKLKDKPGETSVKHAGGAETGDLVVKNPLYDVQERLWDELIHFSGGSCAICLQLVYHNEKPFYKVYEVKVHNSLIILGEGNTPETALRNAIIEMKTRKK